MKRKIVFATNNAHKLEEVAAILGDGYEVLSLREIGCDADIPETADTFAGNALQKAQYVKQHYGYDCFADDSGLEVDALNGAPGVYSARWAGEPANDARNRQKALSMLAGIAQREARFRTVITWIDAHGTQQVEGIVNGHMATEESGDGGFGYDALFIPEGYDATFACLPAEAKNSISHRARALQALREIVLVNI